MLILYTEVCNDTYGRTEDSYYRGIQQLVQ